MPQTRDLVLSQIVCDDLNITRSTLSRWVAAGVITPAVKLPGKRGAFLFDPADVKRVKEARATLAGEVA